MNPSSFSEFLRQALLNSSSHSLWLHSLSYLEHIGYRKIVKAIPYEKINVEVFHHLKDEIEHSFLLKQAACELNPNPLDPKVALQIQQIAENYFQSLDLLTEGWIRDLLGKEDSFLCYMGVSTVIEKRAMKVYPTYYAQLKDPSLRSKIQKIIKDESGHLTSLEEKMVLIPTSHPLDFSLLFEKEEGYFDHYLQQMSKLFHVQAA